MRVAAVNVPYSVGLRSWLRCFRLALRHAPIAGFNEILTRAQKAALMTVVVARGLGVAALRSPNPIIWKRRVLKRKWSRVVRLHDGATGRLAARYPGFNAARFATIGVWKHRKRDLTFGMVLVHFVPAPTPKIDNIWRTSAREQAITKTQALVDEIHALGIVGFLLGDFNDFEPIDFDHVRWIRGHGVDKVGVILPEGVRLEDAEFALFDAPTDHKHGIAARAAWHVAPLS